MSRRVFISVLGASFYNECVYGKGDFRSSKTRFVQQATLEWLDAGGWSEEDAAYILVTQEARKNNWDKNIVERISPKEEKAVPYKPLERVLSEMDLPIEVSAVDIPKGVNEEEIWEIFSILTREGEAAIIHDGDELYFDLTHGFRYLPMLVLVLGNYTKFLRNAKVCGIMYGNFEIRDNNDVAPIIDLLPLTILQDWTFGIADYLRNGYVGNLDKLANDTLDPIKKRLHTANNSIREEYNPELENDVNHLKSCVCSLKKVVLERQTCRGLNVIESNSVRNLKESLKKIHEDNTVLPALMPLLDKVEDSLNDFKHDNDLANMFAAAEWCYKNQQYQAAVTFLLEGLISVFCQRHGIELDDREGRDLVGPAVLYLQTPDKFNPHLFTEEKLSIIKQLCNDELLKKGYNLYSKIKELRDNYNHCGMRKNPIEPQKIVKRIGEYIIEVKNLGI